MENAKKTNNTDYAKVSAANIKRKVTEARLNFSSDDALCEDIKKKTGYLFTRQTLRNYCNGTTKPKVKELVILKQYFGVHSDYILGITETAISDLPTEEEKIMRTVRDYTGLNADTIKDLNYNKNENYIYKGLLCRVADGLLKGFPSFVYSIYDIRRYYESANELKEQVNKIDNYEDLDSLLVTVRDAQNMLNGVRSNIDDDLKLRLNDIIAAELNCDNYYKINFTYDDIVTELLNRENSLIEKEEEVKNNG